MNVICVGDDWTDCFTIPNLKLPDAPYLGFSAETGDVFDNHEYVFFPLPTSLVYSFIHSFTTTPTASSVSPPSLPSSPARTPLETKSELHAESNLRLEGMNHLEGFFPC